jgi:TolA-binding protein
MRPHQLVVTTICLSCVAMVLAPSHSRAQGTEELARGQFKAGMVNLQKGFYQEAMKDFDAVWRQYKGSSVADDALFQKAKYKFGVGEFESAREAADMLVSSYGKSELAPMALVLLGRLATARERTKEKVESALANFVRVGVQYSLSDAVPEALYYAGETQRLMEKNEDAMASFSTVIEEYPRSPWSAQALIGRATILVRAGRPLDAIEALQRVRLRFAGTPEAAVAASRITILYRLYIMPALNLPPFSVSSRKLGAAAGSFKDVVAIGMAQDDGPVVVNDTGLHFFDARGAPRRSPVSTAARGLCFTSDGRSVAVGKGWLRIDDDPLLPLSTPKKDGSAQPLEQIRAAGVLSSGDFLVADSDLKYVARFSSTGKLQGSFASNDVSRIAVDDLDHVAMLERNSSVVVIAGPDGRTLKRIDARGPGYEFRNPVDVAVDRLGHVYVLDRDSGSVFVFTPQGQYRTSFSVPERAPGAFRKATAMALDSAGRLYIYDDRLEVVQVYQ